MELKSRLTLGYSMEIKHADYWPSVT